MVVFTILFFVFFFFFKGFIVCFFCFVNIDVFFNRALLNLISCFRPNLLMFN